MKTLITRTRTSHRWIGRMVLTVTLAASLGGLYAVPARADDDRGHARPAQQHSQRARHAPSHRYEAPRYVTAPPPVYYAPPQPPVIDFVFPLRFR